MKSCKKDLFCGVNRSENREPEKMDALEKKHTPVIDAPDSVSKGEKFKVKVEVGRYKEHPNEHDHFIQFLELYSGDTFLGRVDFTSENMYPFVEFTVKLNHEHPLVAYEHCNMHGTWKSFKKDIKLK